MNVTIQQIADRVGVSKPTVSYALNNKAGQVSAATRMRVLEAAEAMGYRPNWRARSFARQRSNIIGLVYGRRADYIEQSRLVSELVHRLAERDHELLLIPATGPLDRWSHKLRDGRVDGVVIVHPMPLDLDAFVAENKVPAVLANLQSDLNLPQVCFDDAAGTRLAVDHLVGLGHRRIAYFCSPKHHGRHYSNDERGLAFVTAMRERGLGDSLETVELDFDVYADRLAATPAADRPTALVAYHDGDAIGLMHKLWDRGLRVPEHFSLVGFNDDPAARQALPPLTTVATPIGELAARCLDCLLTEDGLPVVPDSDGPDGPNGAEARVVLPEHLVVRGSTAPIPK